MRARVETYSGTGCTSCAEEVLDKLIAFHSCRRRLGAQNFAILRVGYVVKVALRDDKVYLERSIAVKRDYCNVQ